MKLSPLLAGQKRSLMLAVRTMTKGENLSSSQSSFFGLVFGSSNAFRIFTSETAVALWATSKGLFFGPILNWPLRSCSRRPNVGWRSLGYWTSCTTSLRRCPIALRLTYPETKFSCQRKWIPSPYHLLSFTTASNIDIEKNSRGVVWFFGVLYKRASTIVDGALPKNWVGVRDEE